MRNLFYKLFGRKTKWNFRKADLTETTEALKNPARGWYEIHSFSVEEKPDFKALEWCATSQETIALVLLDIGAYQECELDNKALGNMRNILRFFKDNQYDMILRVVYDRHGKALEREPFFFEQVKRHLQQIAPIVKEFEQNIFVYQGMLIGSWGEMHTSRFLAPAKLKELWSILRREAGEQIYYAVRKPAQWRVLHPECCGKMQLAPDKMGLFDDAIFGSESHLGTFGKATRESAGWDNPWRKEDELNFEECLCKLVPNGGEAICGEYYPQDGTPVNTVETLQKMHVTYLNKAYDKNILNIWKQWNWDAPGVWQNVSLYDYIGRHMGYRFVVKDVELSLAEENMKNIKVNITIENVGFANIYQETEVYLEWIDTNDGLHSRKLACDTCAWDSGKVSSVSEEIELMNCKLYLTAKRKQDGRRIFFANRMERGGRVLLGEIRNVKVK